MKKIPVVIPLVLWIYAQVPAIASEPPELAQLLRDAVTYRNLGPFRAGGWISDIAVPDAPSRAHLYTFYVSARSGGVWKTTNNGTTFEPVFDRQSVSSIGALAVAPSNSDLVWVGTGDASCTRSAYWGDGVYKSTDGARSWQNMGLVDSQHISRIVVHPNNPETVYVAAMGHLFSRSAERGVFKTTDGGRSWKKVLYVDDRTGAVDLVINRQNPKILYAATYECQRFAWRLQDGGPGSGIFRSVDGGDSWQRLEGGLPTGSIGRIGIDLHRNNPKILYAVIDNRNMQPPTEEEARQARERKQEPQGRMIGGEVYRTDDAGLTWSKTNSARDDVGRKTGYAFNQLRVDPNRPERIFVTGSSLASSEDGGKSWAGLGGPPANRVFRRAFGDFRTLWIDPENSERMIAGSDGGVFISYDGGKTCDHLANLPLGEIYALTVDMETPYNIYAGLQDHESWKGPSSGWSGSVGLEDWRTVGIGDGMYNQVDPTDSRWVYNTQEFGRHARLDQLLRIRKSIEPVRPDGQPRLRTNWTAPLLLSPHNPSILYAGAQLLFRSLDRGEHWQEISPDLTTNNPVRISGPGTGIQFCTITTLSESPVTPGILWVGTDDGKVQRTTNGGATWTDATAAIAAAGGPEDAWVTRVFASRFAAGKAYVSKSRRRDDDYRPFLFQTTDFGASWAPLMSGLPDRPINVIVEDCVNSNLMFLGNDRGIYVSLDGGKQWAGLPGNMPTVPVHDLLVHPRDGDLVAGTYGRGLWVAPIAPLRELSGELLGRQAHLFAVEPRARRREGALGNYRLYGDRHLMTPNEPNGLAIVYYLQAESKDPVSVVVSDAAGAVVRTLQGPEKSGIHRVVWDMNMADRREAPPGEYAVTLQLGESKLTQRSRILP